MYVREDVVSFIGHIVLAFLLFTLFGGLDWLVNEI